jgi:hypothetical protein
VRRVRVRRRLSGSLRWRRRLLLRRQRHAGKRCLSACESRPVRHRLCAYRNRWTPAPATASLPWNPQVFCSTTVRDLLKRTTAAGQNAPVAPAPSWPTSPVDEGRRFEITSRLDELAIQSWLHLERRQAVRAHGPGTAPAHLSAPGRPRQPDVLWTPLRTLPIRWTTRRRVRQHAPLTWMRDRLGLRWCAAAGHIAPRRA